MRRLSAMILLSLLLGGCGYTICRAFGNSTKQCAYNCFNVVVATGEQVTSAWWALEPAKRPPVEEFCLYDLGKVLMP